MQMRYERLDGGEATIVLAIGDTGAPRLLHFGESLPTDFDLPELDGARAQERRPSTPDTPVPASILPVAGRGFMGEPAVRAAGAPLAWTSTDIARRDNVLVITLRDARRRLRAEIAWRLDGATGVLSASTTLHNDGATPLALDALASLVVPLPAWATEIVAFEGGWSREAHPHRFAAPPGAWVQTNRTGRTGFAGATFLVCEPDASDMRGRALALHLAWSGNHRLGVETGEDGRQAFLFAEFARDEIEIAPGAAYAAPDAYAAFTARGLNGLSDAFHPFVRREVLPPRAGGPRRVHLNSWEAAYFDYDVARLKALADGAAALGVERFVLDDGWFAGRRSDQAGLGDWTVDRTLFPDGLDPLIAHVHHLGMDFGLWVEPEMVNPDSDLYRRHPNWCVHTPGAPRPTMRHQLWLDLSRADVRDHLFATLDALLHAHDIAYLKWDCNRTAFPEGSGHARVTGFYALLDRLRAAHPEVEIESCASGGARIDLAVLRRAVRVWPSDTTDAIERLRIQRWTGLLLPPETLGAHVGPSPNPITGRRLDMAFRARVAMFGHMGVELDPARLSSADTDCLAAHIALYKQHRPLLHDGRRLSWTSDDGAQCWMAVRDTDALALLARADVGPSPSAPVRFPGLDAKSVYDVTLPAPWPKAGKARLADVAAWLAPRTISGAALGSVGLTLPLCDPETAWLVHLRRRTDGTS